MAYEFKRSKFEINAITINDIEYKKGKLNSKADALSQIRPKFQIVYTFDKLQNLVHCISQDFMLSEGFTEQIDKNFTSRKYVTDKNEKEENVLIQPIFENRYKLFH